VSEVEVALAFSADWWVEELHRHLADHGGARVRTLAVEAEALLDESYDVLVVGHRWPALTRAVVADVHARGRAVLGVHDREEAASRKHLMTLGVDALIESDAGVDAFVSAIVSMARTRADASEPHPSIVESRVGRLVTVGGPPGTGRTEIAIQLALTLDARGPTVLVDADDTAPAIAQRFALPIEPNLRTAIDAVEHGLGELSPCIGREPSSGTHIVTGLPNVGAWEHVRPGEIIRVIDRLADTADIVVADGAGILEDIARISSRGRYATGRALVAEADALVVVCDGSPHGLARLLGWIVDAQALAPETPTIVVVNRAPAARFRRGEIYEEITGSAPVDGVVFVPADSRVADAAWNGTPVVRSAFTRAVLGLADAVVNVPRRPAGQLIALEEAS
jgi:MinD-like ATPase involved in chromosome partitioning or flagellar assembly